MFKVLDENGKIVVVEKINKSKHKHLSGREFTKDDKNVTFVK